jgi:hypothetical protein
MRNFFLPIAAIFLLVTSCKETPVFRIDGKVPAGGFAGSKVYLVALDAPITKNVDSTIIENGAFTFKIAADSFAVRILRIPAKFPDIIEDLVVIPEPGTITVVLDSVSHGYGTRLNNILQNWKERKHFHDSLQWDIFQQKNLTGTDQVKIDSLSAVSEKISESMLSDNIKMLNENLFNGIGLLIYKLYFNALPASEKNYVTQKTGKIYLEKDAQLRARFY